MRQDQDRLCEQCQLCPQEVIPTSPGITKNIQRLLNASCSASILFFQCSPLHWWFLQCICHMPSKHHSNFFVSGSHHPQPRHPWHLKGRNDVQILALAGPTGSDRSTIEHQWWPWGVWGEAFMGGSSLAEQIQAQNVKYCQIMSNIVYFSI